MEQYQEQFTLNCENDSELQNYYERQSLVNQFIHALDKHLNEMSQEQIEQYNETVGRYLKLI